MKTVAHNTKKAYWLNIKNILDNHGINYKKIDADYLRMICTKHWNLKSPFQNCADQLIADCVNL
jgi:hypothetical protein